MKLFIRLFRRIFSDKPLKVNKRKEIMEQLKRLKKRDKLEKDSI